MQLEASLTRKLSDCARAVYVARTQVERARTFDERVVAEGVLAQAEQAMQDAAMEVNRGVTRAAPTA